MRIVIDLQGAQSTSSATRGIGRYTSSLTQAMVRLRGEHEIVLALNGQFPDTIDQIKERRNGHEVQPRHQLMPYRLEVRESTAAAE